MARMIPNTLGDDHGSFGERVVFEALKSKLDGDFTVFHSVRWNAPNEKIQLGGENVILPFSIRPTESLFLK